MYLMEELEPSLVASEPRRLLSLILDVLAVGDRIALVSEDLFFDSDAVDITPRDDRVKGLWKQNIVRFVGRLLEVFARRLSNVLVERLKNGKNARSNE